MMRERATDTMSRVLVVLADSGDRIVTTGEIIDRLYGDRPDGGPDYPEGHVRDAVSTLRGHGVDIVVEHRYELAHRRPASRSLLHRRIAAAINAGHCDRPALAAELQTTIPRLSVAMTRMRELAYGLTTTRGYRLRWTSVDYISKENRSDLAA